MSVVALSNKNPYYIARESDWGMMSDAYGGEKYIKDKAQDYLPPTAAMQADGMNTTTSPGYLAYEAYRTRAVYHELVKPSLMAMLGVMHRKAPDIELPAKLDGMRKRATFNGEDLPWLIQKINEQQMLKGRFGLLLDVKDGAKVNDLPYIATYTAESMINWDSTTLTDGDQNKRIRFVVLNETGYERTAGLSWTQVVKYRVLIDATQVADVWPGLPAGERYMAAEVRSSESVGPSQFFAPQLGGKRLENIPFVFIGPRDLVPEPDMPVLMPMARIALAIYRTEADYRQALYMQGQDTLVVIGQQASTDPNQRVGAFGSIELPKDGDAKYIGAQSDGIKELESSIQNDMKRAAQLGSQLLTERGNEAEAAQALNIRVASRTATLTTVAQAAARGMEQVLRSAAEWVDADPDKVKVNPNLDFADDAAQAQDLTYLITAKRLGIPLSNKSIHKWLKKREFTDLEFEQEMDEIDAEPPVGGTPGVAGAPGPGPVVAVPGGKTIAKAEAGKVGAGGAAGGKG